MILLALKWLVKAVVGHYVGGFVADFLFALVGLA